LLYCLFYRRRHRARIDGGGNIDTLILNGNDLILDLTIISNARIQDIDKINISGSGDNTLIVNLNDVLDASTSTNILKVLGNSGDSVNASGFAKISTIETEGSIIYNVSAPALKTSIPPLPVSVSSPAPATNISLPLVPVRVLAFSSPK
jgi:hypothetical protein